MPGHDGSPNLLLTAMVNEVLCKLLCHNLTCLIQEQETLGISLIFGQKSNGLP
jgi:hypothetical protein